MKRYSALLLTVLLFLACAKKNKDVHNHPPSAYYSTIICPAGDIYMNEGNNSIPGFFNIGILDQDIQTDLKTLVLGKRQAKNARIGINPISLFSYQKDTITYKYIIATPVNEVLKDIGQDFNSFSMNNIHLQASIEEWFKSRCAIGVCRNFKWENEYKAFLEISKTESR
ncbi:MAG: hypothetical protein HKN67_07960 [Saprospiraceae bacterium]|nr:hypothetical protein [Bacteroidia bacterium]MBT8229548.1 hypothetical protein [Bacteroidia bacterium]NNF21861.1 hypothetical protein [Saprospiraceae bacterium]NNK90565.1 hypothetical protein [Saprospiraceae bacterium]